MAVTTWTKIFDIVLICTSKQPQLYFLITKVGVAFKDIGCVWIGVKCVIASLRQVRPFSVATVDIQTVEDMRSNGPMSCLRAGLI